MTAAIFNVKLDAIIEAAAKTSCFVRGSGNVHITLSLSDILQAVPELVFSLYLY